MLVLDRKRQTRALLAVHWPLSAAELYTIKMNSLNRNDGLAEARFAALLDAAVDAILVIDEKGHIETFNHAAEMLFGYAAAEVRGRNVSMLMPEPYRSEHDDYIQRYVQTGERKIIGIGREVAGQKKNGQVFPIELSVGEVAYDREPRFVGIIRDLSERKETARQIRQQQERLEHVMRLGSLGEMAAGIAHEINQPLTAISTYSQAARRLIAGGQLEQERLLEILDKTVAQAVRAGEIIRRIRTLARQQPASRELHDVRQVVDEAIQLAESDTRLQRIDLQCSIEPDLPKAWIDVIQVQQVVLNLLHNAIEVEPAPTKLLIHVSGSNEGEVVIEVIDNGPGIPPELLSEIFDPFFTTRTHGTGLGLAISRSIVAAHGGRLEVRNNQDTGATFSVILPTALDETNA